MTLPLLISPLFLGRLDTPPASPALLSLITALSGSTPFFSLELYPPCLRGQYLPDSSLLVPYENRTHLLKSDLELFGDKQDRKTGGVSVLAKKKYLEGMNNFKNGIIALLTGLLALSLFTQPAQSATSTVTTAQFNALQARVKVLELNALKSVKTYDAVKLIEFSFCLDDYQRGGRSNLFEETYKYKCDPYKPGAPDSKTYDAVALTLYIGCLKNTLFDDTGDEFGGALLAYCYRWRP